MSEIILIFQKIAFDIIHGMIYIDDLIIDVISIRPSLISSFGCFHGHVLAIRYEDPQKKDKFYCRDDLCSDRLSTVEIKQLTVEK